MDYNAIRNSWDKKVYSTPLDNLPMKKDLDKFRGCLIGGAAGDALGYAVEFLSENFIKARFGETGITEYQLRDGLAQISDDTQMTMFTANGLLIGTTRGCTRGIMGTYPSYVSVAYLGLSEIPKKYIDNLELVDVLTELADDLYYDCPLDGYKQATDPSDIAWEKKYVYINYPND